MSNIFVAQKILEECWRLGVREIILCAGARNAPFVTLLSQPNPFQVIPYFEERSGAFFALGKMQSEGRPVAIITTSGTAAAELLPATIESDYQGLPLILITADRPSRFRGTGAPQTINQVGLFSHYVEKSWDIEGELPEIFEMTLKRPVHINVCFDEPLIDAKSTEFEQATRVATPAHVYAEPVSCSMREPLVIVSGVPREWRKPLVEILKTWNRPLYLESPSNLREHPDLQDFEIRGGEKTLASLKYDGVIRIGSVPTLRLWRDLEKSSLPVLHFSHLPFSGLPRESKIFGFESLALLKAHFSPWTRDADTSIFEKREELLGEFPLSEPAMVKWLSNQIPQQARIFVGNSLPIREWDMTATAKPDQEIFVNRGVNGIDGLISTFLGLASPSLSNWCVIGDLSALYDLSGLWPAREKVEQNLNLVILNNGGGKIFHRLFHNPLFENIHQLNFKKWAEMWEWDYISLTEPKDLPPSGRRRIIEIIPSNAQTDDFWKAWDKV